MKLFSAALRLSRRLSTAATPVDPAKAKAKKAKARAIARVKSKAPSISKIKTKLKTVRDPDEALKIYNSISTHDRSTNAASVRHAQEYIVRLLAKSGRFSDIETFLGSQKSTSKDEYSMASLIRSYGTAGMFEDAVKTYEQMAEFGTPRTTLSFNALIWACIHCNLFEPVVTYFDDLPAKYGFSPDKYSYGMLIKSYCEMGSPELAIEKLNEMQGKGIELDSIVFTTIYHSLFVNGREQEANSFWDDMVKEKGFKPDVGSYNVKIRNGKHGDEDGLKRLIGEMKDSGIKPDAITYHHIITFYCKNGLVSVAQRVYDEMLRQKGCNPSLATFQTLVHHMCKIGRFVSAFKVYKRSMQHYRILDFETLRWLAEGLTKIEHKTEAKTLIRTMKARLPPNAVEDWGKVATELGLDLDATEEVGVAPDGTEEVDADKIETGDSDKIEDDSDSVETVNY